MAKPLYVRSSSHILNVMIVSFIMFCASSAFSQIGKGDESSSIVKKELLPPGPVDLSLIYEKVPGTDDMFGEIQHGISKTAKLYLFNNDMKSVYIDVLNLYPGLWRYNGMFKLLPNSPNEPDCEGNTLHPNPESSFVGSHCVVNVEFNTARTIDRVTGEEVFNRSKSRAWSTQHRLTLNMALYWENQGETEHITQNVSKRLRLGFNPRSQFDIQWDGRTNGEPIFNKAKVGEVNEKHVNIKLKESSTERRIYSVKSSQFINPDVEILPPMNGKLDCNNVNYGVMMTPGDECAVLVRYKSSDPGESKLKLEVIWTTRYSGGTELGGSPYTLISHE